MRKPLLLLAAAAIWAVCVTALTGCDDTPGGSRRDGSSTTADSRSRNGLPDAIEEAADAGKGYSVTDATDLNRDAHLSAPKWWKVCFQQDDKASQSVEFAVVLHAESCPDERGGHAAAPKTPELAGSAFQDAREKILRMGHPASDIRVYHGSDGVTETSELDSVRGRVCEQAPRAGEDFRNPDQVRLYVAEGACPP